MTFLTDLIDSTDSVYSAYLAFVTGRKREGFAFYAFVEDEDDIEFYQHVISEDDVCFLGCGGKSNVLAIHARAREDSLVDECWFLVDQDTELKPFHNEHEVLRTAGYSWESHCLEEIVLDQFLRRKLAPMPGQVALSEIQEKWERTLSHFSPCLALQLSIIHFALSRNLEAQVSQIILTRDAAVNDMVIEPSNEVDTQLTARAGALCATAQELAHLNAVKDRIEGFNLTMTARGKSAFLVLRAFFDALVANSQHRFRVEYNSALNVIKNVPSSLGCFDYIRDYADRRRAGTR